MNAMKYFTLFLLFSLTLADVYMHNPRGCNDRLNEANEDRNNDQRLFDSQNNDKGGYSWAPTMSYTQGSILPLQWTAQHGCGSNEVECNLVIQYMCNSPTDPATVTIRDGQTTTTIPDNANTFNTQQTPTATNTPYLYGMHESYDSYQSCKQRQRNKGLFTADQNVNGNDATYTRQNPNGNTNNNNHGFECPEERDYYPYWAPSAWKDVAVFTPNMSLCSYFQSESQNVKAKYYCKTTTTTSASSPITQAACTAAGGTWTSQASWGLAAPDCLLADFSRDNHLGNTAGPAQTANYNWTIPSSQSACSSSSGDCSCVLRIRYNISTANTQNWPTNFTDSNSNGATKSPITENPTVTVAGNAFKLAVNTAQYGRTFQDRSQVFNIIPRPQGIAADATIYNLNVRGKRGNIVQTFPATEYDFVPNALTLSQGDYVHFQWTGSNTNPQNYDGQGTAGTDRSNIVQIATLNHDTPMSDADIAASGNALFSSPTVRTQMSIVGQTGCTTGTDCTELNAAPQYFDGGVQQMKSTGTFYYMSTRNNNFSNRTQKGMLVVLPKAVQNLSSGAVAGIVISIFVVGAAGTVGGLVFYAKKNPHSTIGRYYERIPRPSFAKKPNFNSFDLGGRQEPLLN